jgi:hypothetical protein
MAEETQQPYETEPAPAVRAIFEHRGDQVRLVDVVSVAKRLPGSAPLDDRSGAAGNWIELRNARGEPVYRSDLSPALFDGPEVVPESPGGEITRPTTTAHGAFSVILPLGVDADHIALLGNAGAPGQRSPARELLTVPMAELARRIR